MRLYANRQTQTSFSAIYGVLQLSVSMPSVVLIDRRSSSTCHLSRYNAFSAALGMALGHNSVVTSILIKRHFDLTIIRNGMRREELCKLSVKDLQSREGVLHLRIHGKGSKIRFVLLHPMAQRLIEDYLIEAGHKDDLKGPLFHPVPNNRTGELNRPLNPNSVYRNILRKYGTALGVSTEVNGLCVHSLRATAATNALSHDADISKVQEWLGHANVSTTRLYDRRKTQPEDSPTFRVKY